MKVHADKDYSQPELMRGSWALRPASVVTALLAMVCGAFVLSVGDLVEGASLNRAVKFADAGGLAYAALALFLGLKSRRPEAWSLGFALACIALSKTMAPLADLLDLPGKRVIGAGLFALGAVTFINFAQRFPQPLTADKCMSFPGWRLVRKLVTMFMPPFRLWIVLGCTVFVVALMTATGVEEPAHPLHAMTTALVIGFGALCMTVNYQSSNALGRRKLFWVAQAVALSLLIALLYASFRLLARALDVDLPASPGYWLEIVRDVAVLSCLTIALFFAGSIDPTLVIRKTAVYALATTAAVFLFTVFENYVASEMASRLNLDDKVVASIGGAFVGLIFQPMREAINRLCMRVFAGAGVGPMPDAGHERVDFSPNPL